jgi:hypothetical protein
MNAAAIHQRDLVLMVLSSGQGRGMQDHATVRQPNTPMGTGGPASVACETSRSRDHDSGVMAANGKVPQLGRRLIKRRKHLTGYNLTSSLRASSPPNRSPCGFNVYFRCKFIRCKTLHGCKRAASGTGTNLSETGRRLSSRFARSPTRAEARPPATRAQRPAWSRMTREHHRWKLVAST